MRNRFFDRFSYLPALWVLGCTSALAIQPAEPVVLEPGKTVAGEIGGTETHDYQVALQKGQYAQIWIEQHSVSVAIACFEADGRQQIEIDTYPIGEPETIEWIASATGNYRFRVRASDAKLPRGRYGITLLALETATERHKSRVAASLAYAAATKVVTDGKPEGLRKIVALLEQAQMHWHAAGDKFEEARTMYSLGPVYGTLGDLGKDLDLLTRALPIARASGNVRSEPWALFYLGEFYNNYADKRKAIDYYEQSVALMRHAHDRVGEGISLCALGTACLRSGEKRRALALFEQAGEVLKESNDQARLAAIAGNMGVTYSDLGEYRRALENYQRALARQREIGNRAGEALALNNLGTVHSDLAEYQKALDEHTEALGIDRSINARWNTAIDLNNIAYVYANLGDRRRALVYYQEALEILREVKNQWGLAHTLNNVGEIYSGLGDYKKALEYHMEGLALRRAVKDPDGEGISLGNIGKVHTKLGDREQAERDFEQALAILTSLENPRQLLSTLRNMGGLKRLQGEYQRSREYLEQSLATSRAIRDRRGEFSAVAELARVERDCGNLDIARVRAGEALDMLESLRITVASPALRASFFASAREVQELEVEILMQLDKKRPGEGFAAKAFAVAERGRARSLLESLGESSAEIRRGVEPALLNREQELTRLIGAKAERQTAMLARKHTDAEAAAARKELDCLTADLEQMQSRIRKASPQYAALTQPAPLDLSEIQAKVLDDDTVLLEYSLGADKSFLWAVAKTSVDVFTLPAKTEVEGAARRVYNLMNARNQKLPNEAPAARIARLRHADEALPAAAEKASRMLLGPVAARLEGKRLLIVGDGVLQYLPFGALPESGGEPLIVRHEVVVAPSASVIAIMRQETAGRPRAEKELAVVADPVFSTDDARMAQPTRAAAAGTRDFARLRFSRREADQIAKLVPASMTLKALDFNASRETVLSPDFGRHRILHFATHSVLNNERPELSGVVLSLVDAAGRPRNGFLRLYEIYNLRLAADLVVLSACQTALGGEISGEGLIGLTRGFLYAGAPRVVASLWEVDDRTSAELMKRFYTSMLVDGERPAAALRAAQVAMWKTKGWDAPYYWAAYTLQGEWR